MGVRLRFAIWQASLTQVSVRRLHLIATAVPVARPVTCENGCTISVKMSPALSKLTAVSGASGAGVPAGAVPAARSRSASAVVNGVPISGRQKLETRDTIQVGDTEFRLRFGE